MTNTGNAALALLPLTLNFDAANLAFLNAEPTTSSVNGGELVWNNLAGATPLPVGAGRTVTIRYLAQASSNGLPNQRSEQTAQVVGAQDVNGQTAASVQAGDGVRITAPSLTIRKAVADDLVAVYSAPLTFTIHLTNTGDTRLEQMRVADLFEPDEFAFRSAQVTPDQIGAGALTWNDITTLLGDIAPGEAISFTLSFTTTSSQSPLINTMRVDQVVDEHGDSMLSVQEEVEVEVNVAAIELTVTSVPPPLTSVRPGQCLVYDLTVTNIGAVDLTNTLLSTAPPEGTTAVETCPEQSQARLSDLQPQAQSIVWPLGTLLPGAFQTRQLRVVVNADIPITVIRLLAEATSDQTRDVAFTGQVLNPLDPTAVTLLHFAARGEPGGVQVEWITGVEVNTWGFHLWRTPTERWGGGLQVTQEIVPARGSNGGAAYAVHDHGGRASDYYWLEEIETNGKRNLYGPVRVSGVTNTQPQPKLYLPMVER